jgi:hypothetical protein
VHPGAPDAPCDGVDSDCSGERDHGVHTWTSDCEPALYGWSGTTISETLLTVEESAVGADGGYQLAPFYLWWMG